MGVEDPEENYGTTGSGSPDYTQLFQEAILRWDRVLEQFVAAQPYTIVPIMVNETLRDTGVYYSSSLAKLKTTVNALNGANLPGLQSQAASPLSATLQAALGGLLSSPAVQGAAGLVAGVPSSLTAVGATRYVYNFVDFRPFSSMGIFIVNGLDAKLQVTGQGSVDDSFQNIFQLDQANNPVTVAVGSNDYETILGDMVPFVRFAVQALTTPTSGAVSIFAGCRR